jgi:hypothetical protein
MYPFDNLELAGRTIPYPTPPLFLVAPPDEHDSLLYLRKVLSYCVYNACTPVKSFRFVSFHFVSAPVCAVLVLVLVH